MRDLRIAVGTLLILGCTWLLLVTLGFSTLAAGGLKDDSPEWWPTVLDAMFRTPDAFIYIAGVLVGGFCLHRPGMRMTVGRLMVFCGIFAVLLGFTLRAATRERAWSVSRTIHPDGTSHVVTKYRNSFGQGRVVETDEP